MAVTYTAIATTTVGSGGTSNITFSNIPQTYKDLLLMISARSEAAGPFSDEVIRFNGSMSSFTNKYIYGNGSNALWGLNAYSSIGGFTAGMTGNTSTANAFGAKTIYIPNYTSSEQKVYSVNSAAETNAITAYIHLLFGLWDNTSAITSIQLATDSGVDYGQYTIATLYGIKNTI